MRALICSRPEGIDSLHVGELPDPRPGSKQVRVAVEAAAVNFADVLISQGRYQENPALPFAPGMEVAGTIDEVGSEVSIWTRGDRVHGYVGHGGFAERVVVAETQVFATPASMPAETAACLPIAYGTTYHALLDRARMEKGESLLVLGAAGGVGLAAVQVGRAIGAHVIAAVSSDEKEQTVRGHGADEVIRYDHQDLRQSLRQIVPEGLDVVYDPVGGDATEVAFRSLAWEGRHLVIGFAAGQIPALPLNLPLLKGASVVGVSWPGFARGFPEQNRQNFSALNRWWKEGMIDPPITGVFDLDHATDALRELAGRRAIGRLVIRP